MVKRTHDYSFICEYLHHGAGVVPHVHFFPEWEGIDELDQPVIHCVTGSKEGFFCFLFQILVYGACGY